MPWNLLILPLLAGFLFIHECHLYSFRSNKLESERLLLRSAVFGVLFAIFGRMTAVTFRHCASVELYVKPALAHLAPFPYMGTALLALVWGIVAAIGINIGFSKFRGRTWMKLFVVGMFDNGRLRLFHGAMNEETPVLLTLSTRKVYVGYIFEINERNPHDPYFSVALLLSGYRAADTLQFLETENYARKGELGDFTITLSMDNIVSAHVFDEARYLALFAGTPKASSIILS